MADKGFSCASTTCPGTEEGSTRRVEDESSYYVPHPQVEGPGSSAVGRAHDLLVPKHMVCEGNPADGEAAADEAAADKAADDKAAAGKATDGKAAAAGGRVASGHSSTASGWQFNSNLSTMSSLRTNSLRTDSLRTDSLRTDSVQKPEPLTRGTYLEGSFAQGSLLTDRQYVRSQVAESNQFGSSFTAVGDSAAAVSGSVAPSGSQGATYVGCGATAVGAVVTHPATESGVFVTAQTAVAQTAAVAQAAVAQSAAVAHSAMPQEEVGACSRAVCGSTWAQFPGVQTSMAASSSVQTSPVVLPDSLTFVSSVETGYSVVPPPQTVAGTVPECGRWTGDAYGQTVSQERQVPLVQERIVYRRVKQVVERPVEKTTLVPKVIRKEVVEFRQVVTDEVIEVPKPYSVETQVFIPRYVDHPTSCALSQNYLPVYSVAEVQTAVECTRYEPEIRIVDVKVPKVVNGELLVKTRDTKLKHVPHDRVSKAQWNSLVLKINPDLCKVGDLRHLPVHRDKDGQVIAFKPETTVGASLSTL
ncbi:hypothetical protein GNI_001380 [Gregarina niphandrodes]|uniref:Inner membrane complex protein n=1 Tax=Gregarina niphandrodes TaxID=110365 RepID=A0A023BE37_GRENI|nr:hypothetical protein GNI_001380 [Gregarina niphandrodes]EZG89661.1 hypothetical protein GNI_001380 [Gregarina niphandrodes]|eukprot:XP_011128467.1 hypothetical protein GNI_001380 [Gregarina niphandrodes]